MQASLKSGDVIFSPEKYYKVIITGEKSVINRKKGKMNMKEKITEEYEKFENIMKGIDNHLCALMLTDIMASLTTVYKDDKGEINKDYTEFDNMVKNIKELLDSVDTIPTIDLIRATQENLDSIKRITDECKYSMRTLSWIKNDLLKEEDVKKGEEKDA